MASEDELELSCFVRVTFPDGEHGNILYRVLYSDDSHLEKLLDKMRSDNADKNVVFTVLSRDEGNREMGKYVIEHWPTWGEMVESGDLIPMTFTN